MLPPRPCKDIEGCHWQTPFQGDSSFCLNNPCVPASCPFTPGDELSVLWDPEICDARICLWLHSPKTSFIQGCRSICLLPTLHPPEPSPKRHKNPPLCIFNQLPQRHFQELHSSPKTPPFGHTQLHYPSSGTSLEPSTSQHPPFPWLGRQCWGRSPEPAGQDMVWKKHIHVANDIGVRLLVKGFVSDPSPGHRERESGAERQARRGLERENRGG